MRICILSYRSYTYSGGQGVYLRYLSRAFRDMGHQVDIISGPPYPELDEGINLIKLPSLDLYTMSSVRRLFINPRKLDSWPSVVEWLGTMTGYFSEPLAFGMRAYNLLRDSQQKKYDIIHDNQTMSYGVLKLRELGYPVVETIHHPVAIDRDLAIKSASLRNKLGYMRWYSFVGMQMKVARQLSHVITVSEMAKEHIADVFKIPVEKLRVIYNGIDTREFSPSDKVPRLENRLLAVISRDTAVKGLKYLLEALAILRHQHNLELVVVGSTLGDGVTEKHISRLGLQDYVSFTDQLDAAELVNQYRQATITVVPSIYEGFGLPAAEAMACGCPVVCTTAGALPEVVGDAGIMVSPTDVQALAHAIDSLMENPYRRKHLANMGHQRIVENFNWSTTAKQTLAIYTEAIEFQKRLSAS